MCAAVLAEVSGGIVALTIIIMVVMAVVIGVSMGKGR
jgi:hypothetical protein